MPDTNSFANSTQKIACDEIHLFFINSTALELLYCYY